MEFSHRLRRCLPRISIIPGSFFDNYTIFDVLRSSPLLKPSWRRPFHALNSASESDPINVTTQEGGNASLAMNDVPSGTTTKDRLAALQTPASMRVNLESVSNEIDESDSQDEKQSEQRI
jgi:hypothetical protein